MTSEPANNATTETVTVMTVVKKEDRVLSDALASVLKNKPTTSIAHIKKGDKMNKVRKSGEYPRYFFLNDTMDKIKFRSKGFKCTGGGDDKNVDVADIVDVREGCKTDILNDYYDKTYDVKEDRCFSVIHGFDRDSLDLVAPSSEVQQHWVKSLNFLSARAKAMEERDTQDRWLRRYYKQADKNLDGVLSFDEICKLLDKLNVQMKKKEVKKIFQEACATTDARTRKDDEALDFKAFARLYRAVARRPEIEKIFSRYSHGDMYLTPAKLVTFLVNEQKDEELTEEKCVQLIRKHEPIEENKTPGQERLGIDGFVNLLRSPSNSVNDTRHARVNQDMTRPLTDYFIASSHNTYLTEHQLKGPSSVESYINVLQKGCRLVELDCFDGSEDDGPKVTHGFTLAGDIRLKDVCEAIRDFGFQTTPYPVILSIENHLSVDQQKAAARIFRDTFGEMMYCDPVPDDLDKLPSPEQLKYKVIVKNKKLPQSSVNLTVSDDEEEEEAEANLDDFEKEEKVRDEQAGKRGRQKKAYSKGGKKLAPELSNLVNIMQGTRFRGIEYALKSLFPYHMSSLKESVTEDLMTSQGPDLVRFTNRFLVKVYPKGGRIWDSSNLRPYRFWPGGCQIVALNYQYAGENMQLNDAMFARNGNCGYTLKPDFLRTDSGSFNPSGPYSSQMKRHLRVTIISGQNLPKALGDKKDIVDPFVKVKVYGVEPDNQMGKTQTVKNNGLNPMWSQQFTFHVHVPELAFLRFVVKDEDKYTDSDFLGQFTTPLASVQEGFRHVHLFDKSGNSIAPATLFVHIKLSNSH